MLVNEDYDKCSLEEETYTQFHKRGISSTYSAILSAARLFHQRGSEKYGRSDLFEAFLAGNCIVYLLGIASLLAFGSSYGRSLSPPLGIYPSSSPGLNQSLHGNEVE